MSMPDINKMTLREKIAQLLLGEVKGLCAELEIYIDFDEAVAKCVTKNGFNQEYGARPLKRTIVSLIENPLSDKILSGEIKKGDRVSVFCENDTVRFKVHSLI